MNCPLKILDSTNLYPIISPLSFNSRFHIFADKFHIIVKYHENKFETKEFILNLDISAEKIKISDKLSFFCSHKGFSKCVSSICYSSLRKIEPSQEYIDIFYNKKIEDIYCISSQNYHTINFNFNNSVLSPKSSQTKCDSPFNFRCVDFNETYFYCFYLCNTIIYGGPVKYENDQIMTEYEYPLNILINSKGIRKYSFSISKNILCSISINRNIECLKYTFNYDTMKTNEDSIITVLKGCNTNIKDFKLSEFTFNNDNEILVCCTNGTVVKCQRLDSSLNPKNNKDIILVKGNYNFLDMQQIDKEYMAITFKSYNKDFFLYSIQIPNCKNFTITGIVLRDTNIIIDFENKGIIKYTKNTLYVIFEDYKKPDFGYITHNGNDNIKKNDKLEIKKNNLRFISNVNKTGKVTYKYKLYSNETFYSINTCKITIEILPCYKSCSKCSDIGIESKHNCIECNKGYYFSPDIYSTNCYFNPNEKEDKWYVPKKGNPIRYNICDNACKTCFDGKNSVTNETNCYECANNYYLTEGLSISFCRKVSEIDKNKYFLDDKEKIIKIKCHEKSKKCIDVYDEKTKSMNCKEYKEEYNLIIDTSNCVNDDSKEKAYYLNNDKKYYPCFENCNTCCGGRITEFNQKCLSYKKSFSLYEENCVKKYPFPSFRYNWK